MIPCGIFLRYCEGVGITPLEPAAPTASQMMKGYVCPVDGALIEEMWQGCAARAWGLTRPEFEEIVCDVGKAANFGLADGAIASPLQQAEFFCGLRLEDLLLARSCADGSKCGWEHFVAEYREPLTRAATAMTGSETMGRELADQLYGELFGLTERDGERRCPLASYRGRGSLMGWLRTTLAQRHVDYYRHTRWEAPIEDVDAVSPEAEETPEPAQLSALERAVGDALSRSDAEERFVLAAYFLDGRTLAEIGRVLGVHEATVSRRMQRALEGIRKQVLRNLQIGGMSRRAAREALGTDPRDLDLNLKKLLQQSEIGAFQEKAGG